MFLILGPSNSQAGQRSMLGPGPKSTPYEIDMDGCAIVRR